MNSRKIILDLCGGTGSWSRPYKDAGYEVRVITLPHYDLFETVMRERELEFHNHTTSETEIINADEVYGILCAPTCTNCLAYMKGKSKNADKDHD